MYTLDETLLVFYHKIYVYYRKHIDYQKNIKKIKATQNLSDKW